jgi:hypothetical protein
LWLVGCKFEATLLMCDAEAMMTYGLQNEMQFMHRVLVTIFLQQWQAQFNRLA